MALYRTGLDGICFVANVEGLPAAVAFELRESGARLASKLTWNGSVIRAGDAVELDDDDDELAEIMGAAYEPDGNILLVLRLLQTAFIRHVNAYEIEQAGECILLSLSRVACLKPTVIHTVYGSRFIVLKYRV